MRAPRAIITNHHRSPSRTESLPESPTGSRMTGTEDVRSNRRLRYHQLCSHRHGGSGNRGSSARLITSAISLLRTCERRVVPSRSVPNTQTLDRVFALWPSTALLSQVRSVCARSASPSRDVALSRRRRRGFRRDTAPAGERALTRVEASVALPTSSHPARSESIRLVAAEHNDIHDDRSVARRARDCSARRACPAASFLQFPQFPMAAWTPAATTWKPVGVTFRELSPTTTQLYNVRRSRGAYIATNQSPQTVGCAVARLLSSITAVLHHAPENNGYSIGERLLSV